MGIGQSMSLLSVPIVFVRKKSVVIAWAAPATHIHDRGVAHSTATVPALSMYSKYWSRYVSQNCHIGCAATYTRDTHGVEYLSYCVYVACAADAEPTVQQRY